MKIFILFFLMYFPMVSLAQKEAVQNEIKWETNLSWNQILEKAKIENKYVFLDCYASWCMPCKKMDKETYLNDTIINILNNVISVRIQMDTSVKDDKQKIKWYSDAHNIKEEYQISAYPSFLFFGPDGRLVYKDLGYKNVTEFISVVHKALNPESSLHYLELVDFNKGIRDVNKLKDLAVFVKDVLFDSTLSREIANYYINHLSKDKLLDRENILFVLNVARNKNLADSLAYVFFKSYLNLLTANDLCSYENLQFINIFNKFIEPNDNVFKIFYSNPKKIDEIFKSNGFAMSIVYNVIVRSELITPLLKNNKPIIANPNWDSIQLKINEAYSKVDAEMIVLDFKIYYYKKLKDWVLWEKYQDQKILHLIKSNSWKQDECFWELNLPAWDAFINCNDKTVLSKALEWSILSIQLGKPNPNVQCFDTNANLLYKLGKVKEAIRQEERALEYCHILSKRTNANQQFLNRMINEFGAVLKQMKNGEPTYLNEGAIWNENTLPKSVARY